MLKYDFHSMIPTNKLESHRPWHYSVLKSNLYSKKLCGVVTEIPAVSATADGIKNTDSFAFGNGTIST